MKTAPPDNELTFAWPVERGFPFVLFVCVGGSLFAHAATFFLFQVVYPQRVTIPQPSPHVSLLTASSPENIALLRWIEAEDPALIAGDNSINPPALAEVRYRPSFATPRTAPLGAPEEKPLEVPFPAAIDHLVVAELPTPIAPSPQSGRTQTAIYFTTTLAARPLLTKVPLKPSRRTAEPVSPTVVLLGVNAEGEVRYHFLQQSSGDPTFDEMAGKHVRDLKFASTEAAMTWAHATVAWGGDVYAEADAPAPDAR